MTRGYRWLLLAVCAPAMALAQPPQATRFSTADGLPSNAAYQLVEDRHGYLWFATDDGLARFDGRHFRVWRREQGLVDNQLRALAVDDHDQLWMGTRQGAVMRMSADRSRIDHVGGVRDNGLADAAIRVLLPDPDGGVWFGARGAGLLRLEPPHRLRQYLPTLQGDGVPAGDVEHLLRDAEGGLWIGTTHGLARWHGGRFHRPTAPRLADASISGLSLDGAGVLWISSAAGRWRGHGGERVQEVRAHAEDRLLGIGGDDAHWLADARQVWRQPVGGAAAVVTLAVDDPRDCPHLRRVVEDRHGAAWLLGTHAGIWRLPPLWQHFRAQPAPRHQAGLDGYLVASGRSSAELTCAQGRYWRIHDGMLERGGVDRRRRARWPLTRIGVNDGGPLSLHCAPDGGVWLGSAQGVVRWTGARFEPLPGAPRDVTALHVDGAGGLWMAAAGGIHHHAGPSRLSSPTLQLGPTDGMPPLQVQSLASDADGVVWATVADGLLRMVPARREIRSYSRDDGIPEALLQGRLQAQGDTMLAVGRDGQAVAFAPSQLARPVPPPALVIERVQVRRGDALVSLPPLAPLTLLATDRDLQITARVLSAQLDPHQQYRFRWRDGDAGWSRTRNRGTVGFPRLDAGLHVLQYQQRGSDGHWSALQELPLQVQRGRWQHPAAHAIRLASLAMLLGVMVWAVRRSIGRRRAQRGWGRHHHRTRQSAAAKADYLATFGHEVRTPLTGVLGMSELLLASALAPRQRRRLRRIQRGGRQLLAIVDQALDDARMEAGRLPLQPGRFDLLALLHAWGQRMQLDRCGQGSSAAICLHLPGATWVEGDAARVRQLLQALVEGVSDALPACRLVIQVGWLPGRSGVLLDLHALPLTGMPVPAEPVVRAALRRALACARALHGRLWLAPRCATGWRLGMHLPLLLSADCAGAVAEGADVPRSGRGDRPLLLIEHDPVQAGIHAARLAACGVQVVIAAHALAALAALATTRFEVVLLDLDLPGVDGWHLLQLLRAQGCAAPVVMLDAGGEHDLAARARAAGAIATLRTPADAGQLHAAVRAALAG